MMRHFRKILFSVSLIAFTLLLLWRAQPAHAHASFVRSDPAPNSVLPEHIHRITIWFTEPLEPAFSEIQVFNAQGDRVDSGDSNLHADDPKAISVSLPSLPDGIYTVAWHNVSTVDGHALRGSFVISFGQSLGDTAPTESAVSPALQSPLEPVARWLVLAGLLTLVGGLGFEMLLLRPFLVGSTIPAQVVSVVRLLMRRSRWLMWLAATLFAIGSVWQLLLQAAKAFQIPINDVLWPEVEIVLQTSEWGQLWLWRLWLFSIVLAGLIILTLMTSSFDEASDDDVSESPASDDETSEGDFWEDEDVMVRLARPVMLLAELGLLLTLSLTSHAAAMGDLRIAALFSDILHMLAAAFWVGGLFHFALSASPLFHHLPAEERHQLLGVLVPRFSVLAFLSVGTLVITGLYSTWAHVGHLPALVTPYGLTLLGKLALFLPMLLLGALNLLRTSPRVRSETQASTWLRRAVTGEALLGLVLLLATGLLTSLEPARQVADRQGLGQERELTYQERVERTDISLAIEPALVGKNRFVIELHDPQGRPISNASEVSLELSYLNAELGESSYVAQEAEAGQYVLENVLLSISGDWQVNLLVRRPDAFDTRAAFRFDVISASNRMASVSTGYVLWGFELVLLGLLFLAVTPALGGWRSRRSRVITVPGTLALLVGLFLALGSPFFIQTAEQPQRNPFPPTAESVATGETIYNRNCQTCHGASGLGDGPAATTLEQLPANLVTHVPLHADAELFAIIRDGKPGTPMPAFDGRLKEDEIWHLINFLRTLPDSSPPTE